MRIVLTKENSNWNISVDFGSSSGHQEDLLKSVEVLSFVQHSPSLADNVIEMISSQYGADIADEALDILSKAMALSSLSGELSRTKETMSSPIIDGIIIDQK